MQDQVWRFAQNLCLHKVHCMLSSFQQQQAKLIQIHGAAKSIGKIAVIIAVRNKAERCILNILAKSGLVVMDHLMAASLQFQQDRLDCTVHSKVWEMKK